MGSIKDLIYFDLEKARSIGSQLKGGLINEIYRAFEDVSELNSGLGFNIKIIQGNIGGKDKEKQIRTEKIELYHELLNQIEIELENKNLLTDINEVLSKIEDSYDDFIQNTRELSYIRATGWSLFEDFERFKKIFSNFNEIQKMVYTAQLKENPDFKQIKEQLKEAKVVASKIENRGKKSKEILKIKAIEKRFDMLLSSQTEIYLFDEDFIERIKIFLDTFSPERLNFRLLPHDTHNDFQILANLKEKYLVDSNFESIIYTYGTRPNIKLSVLGIITSAPSEKDQRVNPNAEYLNHEDDSLDETERFDKAFRNVFSSFEAFEKFFFVPSYPKLAISPIAIYREIKYDE